MIATFTSWECVQCPLSRVSLSLTLTFIFSYPQKLSILKSQSFTFNQNNNNSQSFLFFIQNSQSFFRTQWTFSPSPPFLGSHVLLILFYTINFLLIVCSSKTWWYQSGLKKTSIIKSCWTPQVVWFIERLTVV